jgi:hypothetical protein
MRLTLTTAATNPREEASKKYKPQRHEGHEGFHEGEGVVLGEASKKYKPQRHQGHEGFHEGEGFVLGVDTLFVDPFVTSVS